MKDSKGKNLKVLQSIPYCVLQLWGRPFIRTLNFHFLIAAYSARRLHGWCASFSWKLDEAVWVEMGLLVLPDLK